MTIAPVNPDIHKEIRVNRNSEIPAAQRDPEPTDSKFVVGETESMRIAREAKMQSAPINVSPPPAYPVTFKQALTQSKYSVKDGRIVKNVLFLEKNVETKIGASINPEAKYAAASENDIKKLFEEYQQELKEAGIDDPLDFLVTLLSQDDADKASVDALLKKLPQLKKEMGYAPEDLLVFFNQAAYYSKDSLALLSADVLNKLAANGITDTETVARIFSGLAAKKSDEEREQFISNVVKLNVDLQSLASETEKYPMNIKHYETALMLAEPEKTQLLQNMKEQGESYLFDKDKWLLAMLKFNSLDGLAFDRQLSCLKKIVDKDLETRFGFIDVSPVNYAEQMNNFPATVKESQLDYLLEQRGVKSLVDLLKPEDKAKINQHWGIDIDSEYFNGEKDVLLNGMLGQNKELLNAMLAEYYSLGFLTDKNLDKIVELFLNVILAIPKEALDSFDVYDGDYAELFSKTLQSLGYTGIGEYVFDNTAGVVLAGIKERIKDLPLGAQTLHDKYIRDAARIVELKARLDSEPGDEMLRQEINRLETENKGRIVELEKMLEEADSLTEKIAIAEAIVNVVKAGQEAGSISETEANKILVRANQVVLNQLLANSLEFKNFLQSADFSQTQLSPGASTDQKLEYLKKLIEDTYSLSKLIAAKNAENEKEEQLKKNREELASLNVPQAIRTLLSQIYGIDFESIDGAVARTLAEKISRNEKIKLG